MTLCTNLNFGDDAVLPDADIPPGRFQPMRSAYLTLKLASADEAERIYALLGDGGQIVVPMTATFFASRVAKLRDQFGAPWMLPDERPATWPYMLSR